MNMREMRNSLLFNPSSSFCQFSWRISRSFSKAPGEGNGIIVLVDRIRRILDVNIQSFDGLGAFIIAGNQNLVSFKRNGYVPDLHFRLAFVELLGRGDGNTSQASSRAQLAGVRNVGLVPNV